MQNNKNKIVIVVDGTSASGKGTLSKLLANELHFAYLDTGLLYRAVGLFALQNNLVVNNTITNLLPIRNYALKLDISNLNKDKLTPNAVAEAASLVAKDNIVRKNLIIFQHLFAENPMVNGKVALGSVLDGRDLGSVVFPNAQIKFFVNANLNIRAKRRYLELYNVKEEDFNLQNNGNNNIKFNAILESLKARDYNDANRTVAPLKQTEDAILIDNSINTIQDSVKLMLAECFKKISL